MITVNIGVIELRFYQKAYIFTKDLKNNIYFQLKVSDVERVCARLNLVNVDLQSAADYPDLLNMEASKRQQAFTDWAAHIIMAEVNNVYSVFFSFELPLFQPTKSI